MFWGEARKLGHPKNLEVAFIKLQTESKCDFKIFGMAYRKNHSISSPFALMCVVYRIVMAMSVSEYISFFKKWFHGRKIG